MVSQKPLADLTVATEKLLPLLIEVGSELQWLAKPLQDHNLRSFSMNGHSEPMPIVSKESAQRLILRALLVDLLTEIVLYHDPEHKLVALHLTRLGHDIHVTDLKVVICTAKGVQPVGEYISCLDLRRGKG